MRLKLLVLFIFFCSLHASANEVARIDYQAAEAGEVWLVWGISNWQTPAPELWPDGSYQKEKLVYSPMRLVGDAFEVSLSLPKGTLVDYVFWISKSPFNKPFDRWDVNRAPLKDYHLVVTGEQHVHIRPTISIHPSASLSILDIALPWLVLVQALLLLFAWFRRKEIAAQFRHVASPVVILAAALVLWALFFVSRATIAGLSWGLYFNPRNYLSAWLAAGYEDFVFVLLLVLIFLSIALFLRRFTRITKAALAVYFLLVIACMVISLLNIRVVELLGRPFNYRWFYYSDYLQSSDAKAALGANIEPGFVYSVLLVCGISILIFWLFVYALSFVLERARMTALALTSLLFLGVTYYSFAKSHVLELKIKPELMANPVSDFIRSVNPFAAEPDLFTMPVDSSASYVNQDKEPFVKSPLPPFRNILLLVLESTPAEYLTCYGGAYGVSPALDLAAKHAVLFDCVYAHAPATNNSMFSMLCSSYPWISYNSITKEHPDIPLPSISSVLGQQGYRTAFFNAGDNRFQQAGLFLSNQGFEKVSDYAEMNCSAKEFEVDDKKWQFLNGKDDACSTQELLNWVERDPKKPFFAMLWTYQTHYPYFFQGPEEHYVSDDPFFNRYLNAVHHSDELIGTILAKLASLHLSESTLVVVVGDHGEAFGQHGQTTHASGIYEENIHVPCLFINPQISAERRQGAGGLVDLAPTLLEGLGKDVPATWQGRSLFQKKKDDYVFFFSPWSDYLFGYRNGNKKYIYNASRNTTQFFDLKKDPKELNTTHTLTNEELLLVHKRLAFWVQENEHRMTSILNSTNASPGSMDR